MFDFDILAVEVAHEEFLRGVRGVEALTEDFRGGGADFNVWGGCECEERGGFYGVFLVGGVRWEMFGLVGLGLGVGGGMRFSDLGDCADVLEPEGDLLYGYEGEDAEAEPQIVIGNIG